jgi:hypothetical protein
MVKGERTSKLDHLLEFTPANVLNKLETKILMSIIYVLFILQSCVFLCYKISIFRIQLCTLRWQFYNS